MKGEREIKLSADVIDIKTRRGLHAKEIEEVPVQHETFPFDPKIEKIMLRMQDMDEEGKQDLFRYIMKVKNRRKSAHPMST